MRAFDDVARRIEVDVLLHEPPGPAPEWAFRARPGDHVGLRGPCAIRLPDPVDWAVLAGDRSALPAIAFTLERLPPSARGLAIVLDEGGDARHPLTGPPGFPVRWTSSDLPAAVLSAPWPASGRAVLWAGAEARIADELRAVAATLGLGPRSVGRS